jgi:hypothetical protein
MTTVTPRAGAATAGPKPFYASFGFQVLAAMVIGLVLGWIARNVGPDAAGQCQLALTQTLATTGSSFVSVASGFGACADLHRHRRLDQPICASCRMPPSSSGRRCSGSPSLRSSPWSLALRSGSSSSPASIPEVAAEAAQGAVLQRLLARFPEGSHSVQHVRAPGFHSRRRRWQRDHQPQLQRAADCW